MTLRFSAFMLGIMIMLSGCSFSRTVAEHSIRYNQAVGEAHDQQLLLNVVRAKDRLPMHFTSISEVRGSLTSTFGTKPDAKFGGDATDVYALAPDLSFRSNPTFVLGTLNSQEFMKGILTPVSLETVNYYLEQGWPIDLLFYLLVESVTFPKPPLEDNKSELQGVADLVKVANGVSGLKAVWGIEQFSLWTSEEDRPAPAGSDRAGSRANSSDQAELAFRALATWLVRHPEKVRVEKKFSPFGPALQAKSIDELVRAANSKRNLALSTNGTNVLLCSSTLVLSISDPTKWPTPTCSQETGGDTEGFRLYDAASESPKDVGESQKDEAAGRLVLRSPHGILYFLGELARRTTRNEAAIRLPGGEILFTVQRGRAAAGDASIKIELGDQTYYVPSNGELDASDPESPAGRSMQSLALVSQLLSLQKKAKELPTTGTVTVVGGV
ncbi:MAG: hypothetical protein AAGC60_27135 [Acidobacteriota bacterium]